MDLEPASARVLLGGRVAQGTDDSRALAATVVFAMPARMREVPVHEFLGWVQGSTPSLVQEYERAATIYSRLKLGELKPFQRAALIGALRLRRQIR